MKPKEEDIKKACTDFTKLLADIYEVHVGGLYNDFQHMFTLAFSSIHDAMLRCRTDYPDDETFHDETFHRAVLRYTSRIFEDAYHTAEEQIGLFTGPPCGTLSWNVFRRLVGQRPVWRLWCTFLRMQHLCEDVGLSNHTFSVGFYAAMTSKQSEIENIAFPSTDILRYISEAEIKSGVDPNIVEHNYKKFSIFLDKMGSSIFVSLTEFQNMFSRAYAHVHMQYAVDRPATTASEALHAMEAYFRKRENVTLPHDIGVSSFNRLSWFSLRYLLENFHDRPVELWLLMLRMEYESLKSR